MNTALIIMALLFALLGIVGAIVPILPGAVLSFIGLVFCYFTDQTTITTGVLLTWLLISVLVTLADMFLPTYFTKRLGGSKSGVWGATIGMIVGFIAFPPLGVIFCPVLGAVMGELINDKTDIDRAIKVGMASLVAFLVGTALKFAVSVYIFWIVLSSQSESFSSLVEWAKTSLTKIV